MSMDRNDIRLRSGRGNMWGDNFGLADALNMPRASMWRAAALAVVSGTPTSLAWDTAEYDTDGMNVGGGRLTARTAGVYDYNTTVGFQNEAAGYRQVHFRKNGAGVYGIVTDTSPSVVSYDYLTTSFKFTLNAGDFIDVVITSTAAGAGLSIDPATATNRVNCFQACLISTIN